MPQSPKSKLGYSDPLAATYSVPMLRLNYTGGDVSVSAGTVHTIEWTNPPLYDTHEMWQAGNPSVIDFVNVPTGLYLLSWNANADWATDAVGYLRLDNDTTQTIAQSAPSTGDWSGANFPFRVENGQTLRMLMDNTSASGHTIEGGTGDRLYLALYLLPGTESRS